MAVDLHTHTIRSDGTTTPTQNVELAASAGLRGLAVTDHDTLAGWDEADAACRARGLAFVPGVELSTELAGRSVHLLGYWVDPDDRPLVDECARLREERRDRAGRILERLALHGVDIDPQRVAMRAGGAPIGRPHVAAAMVDAGVVASVREAFDVWLHDGGPAYVPKHAVAPADGVRLLRGAGGAVVLAHPGLSSRDAPVDERLLDELVAAGLDGVEADHAGHEPDVADRWRELARERELVATGSSDFHGATKDVALGARTTSLDVVESLRRRTS